MPRPLMGSGFASSAAAVYLAVPSHDSVIVFSCWASTDSSGRADSKAATNTFINSLCSPVSGADAIACDGDQLATEVMSDNVCPPGWQCRLRVNGHNYRIG